MEKVEFVGGPYCMDDANARNVIINLEKYRGALDKCNSVIELYNKSIQEGGE